MPFHVRSQTFKRRQNDYCCHVHKDKIWTILNAKFRTFIRVVSGTKEASRIRIPNNTSGQLTGMSLQNIVITKVIKAIIFDAINDFFQRLLCLFAFLTFLIKEVFNSISSPCYHRSLKSRTFLVSYQIQGHITIFDLKR